MNKIEVKKISYRNLTVDQYQRIHNINDIDRLIAILYNVDIDDLDMIDMDNYIQLTQSLDGFKKNINKRYKYLLIEDTKFHYKDINQIKYGEYLDCLEYIKTNDIIKLMAVFYRLAEERKFDSLQFENYEFDIDIRSEYFRQIPVTYFFQIKSDLEKLDKVINTSFKALFDNEESTETIDQLEGRDKAMFIHNQKIKQSYNERAWEYVTYSLANEDITKFDEVYNMPLFTVFNYMLLQKDLELRSKTKT